MIDVYFPIISLLNDIIQLRHLKGKKLISYGIQNSLVKKNSMIPLK